MQTDRLIGAGFLVFSALLWFVIIPAQAGSGEEAFMSRLSVLVIAVPALIMTLRTPRSQGKKSFDPDLFLRVTIPNLLLFVVYLVAMEYLGCFSSSYVFLLISLWLFGERRKILLALTPLVCLSVVYVIIIYMLKFELPAGLLF